MASRSLPRLTMLCATRTVCPTGQPQTQSVGQTFVNTAVPAGDCIWLNSKLVRSPVLCR